MWNVGDFGFSKALHDQDMTMSDVSSEMEDSDLIALEEPEIQRPRNTNEGRPTRIADLQVASSPNVPPQQRNRRPAEGEEGEEVDQAQIFYHNARVPPQDTPEDEQAQRWYQESPPKTQGIEAQQPPSTSPQLIQIPLQTLQAYQSSLQEKETLLRQQTNHINLLTRQIATLQEGRFKSLEAATWAPEPLSTITRHLANLQSAIKQWAEKHSNLPLEQVLAPTQWNKLWRLLMDRNCISSSRMLRERLVGLKKVGRASALLLGAAVSADVWRFVVGDPFFAFVGTGERERGLSALEADGLHAVLDRIGPSDEAACHALRCQVLRLLDPPLHVTGKAADRNRKVAADSRTKAAEMLARKILRDFTGILIPDVKARDASSPPRASLETFVGLKKLILEAAQLSWSLQTRKTHIRILSLRNLVPPGHPNSRVIYSRAFEALEPHPLHTALLDDDPQALDGSPVVLLASPAVQARGTADGEGYAETARLWKKAVVWMGAQEE